MRKENKPVAMFVSILCLIFGMCGVAELIVPGVLLLICALT